MKRQAFSGVPLGSLDAGRLRADWFEQAPVGVGLVDLELNFVLANPALKPWTGEAALSAALQRALGGEAIAGAPLADGALALAFPARDAAGAIVGAGVVVADATARAVPAAVVAAERLRLALEGTETGAWEWDFSAGRVTWSPNLGPLYGLEPVAAPADFDSYLDLIHPEDREELSAAVAAAAREGIDYEREFRALWPDGTVRWLHSRAHVVRGADGRPTAVVGLVGDVTERRRRRLGWEFLARASLVLSESLDARTMLQQVAELAIPDLADWCAVHLRDERGAPVRVALGHAVAGGVTALVDPAAAEPLDRAAPTGAAAVIRTGRSELYPEIDEAVGEVDAARLGLLPELPLRSALIVPLSARGSTLGAITFVYTGGGREYSTTELELAEELGRRAGLALDNARLHADVVAARERAERANQRLRDLQSVIDVGLAHLELGQLLAELLARIREVTATDAAAVLLLDEDRRELRVRAASGIEAGGATLPLGQGVAGRVAASGSPLIVEDVSQPGAPVPRLGGRSLVAVPLRYDGETIGVLQVSAGTTRRFGSEDVELLELVADRAARAIGHARLYARAQDVAITLQRSLLPARLPSIAGLELSARYLPAQSGTEVGGDWYDVFELDDERVAVAVGDIVGRGLRAAALMGQLRNAVRAYAVDAESPSEAVMRVDRLVARLGELSFATVVVLFIAHDGRLLACSAGHPPPLMVGPGGAGLLQMRQGPPIGSEPEERVDSEHELPAGASLVLYTDGLVEDRRSPLDAGLHALVRAARSGPESADGLLEHIARTLLEGRPRDDDIALLALRRA